MLLNSSALNLLTFGLKINPKVIAGTPPVKISTFFISSFVLFLTHSTIYGLKVSQKQIVMCPPEFFSIEYSINPWMNMENKVIKERAFVQYNFLKESFRKSSVVVNELTPVSGLPDMVFATNAGYAGDNKFIKANFRARQRKHEADKAGEYFAGLGYQVFTMPEEICFEGEGDLIRSESKFFLGCGIRSDQKAAEFIGNIIEKEIIPLELVNPYFYHLDTCFGPVNDDLVIINEEAFSEKSLRIIRASFKHVIAANKQDNSVLGCNLIVVGTNVFLGKGISEILKKKLLNFGYIVNEMNMSEFLKGGGSVKCLTLEVFGEKYE